MHNAHQQNLWQKQKSIPILWENCTPCITGSDTSSSSNSRIMALITRVAQGLPFLYLMREGSSVNIAAIAT